MNMQQPFLMPFMGLAATTPTAAVTTQHQPVVSATIAQPQPQQPPHQGQPQPAAQSQYPTVAATVATGMQAQPHLQKLVSLPPQISPHPGALLPAAQIAQLNAQYGAAALQAAAVQPQAAVATTHAGATGTYLYPAAAGASGLMAAPGTAAAAPANQLMTPHSYLSAGQTPQGLTKIFMPSGAKVRQSEN